ncbi:TetR/AcrR family transcriptional regulator [Paenibacillus doosanensis]|uniref:HTH-type transcriptional regulator AcrR n=1 Tax=Paenibacillus konkukensis TaxID=2020716 RepID=A0ABY4RHR9_9BACL|nr:MULTISPECIES: TetR/AcrR family transcriptional regulator [Paenibacillus]MCS7460600.1 TetR/AcrR family transcriptional regulator [Paenibacillus doosanensis]UQZ81179.1 HTH-type transcriptional regulator AcrR [Paenibacillus konkukensis]
MTEDETVSARPERRDAAENRRRILQVAMRLFEQHGVEPVSMNQIAAEAKLGPGTLYRRYKNKSELCLDLIKEHLDLLFEDMEAYLERHRTEPPEQRLKGLIRLFIGFREKKSQLLAGVEDAPPSNRRPRSKSPIYEELHQLILPLFDEMNENGPAPDPTFRADMLLGAMSRDSYVFQRETRGYTPDEIWEQLCLTFIPQRER